MRKGTDPRLLPALHRAWLELCAGRPTRKSLSAAEALDVGTLAQREAVADALLALGWPDAMASPRALGMALGRTWRARAPDGRWMERARVRGGARWFVMRVASGPQPPDPAEGET